ncbi:LuxR C-terminal-related transcriptional regulator [Candidatus Symbiopectobacterium sp. NZEC151]|uniref:LuxR C-terminal-related transcriptional regulator n=1 Tax=Candidatus Symbiopectobacterium sp. NZEC151 TaxID=2820470 RepID=UPI002227F03A|nr:LuxR C-terminal-related transcriptional regulator [Candidatus Symbiopectobacterium sp. NZEC151]MCW2477150.1 helix-turn-helix transcriptional regulator [Candidatus Symbiopectobacterium sp. NZEC151]
MAFLPPMQTSSATLVNQEPFRFTRKLPLILTKFTPPRSPGTLLQRDRLLQRLDSAASSSLTLVCAAAGFGKTTLLTQWYQHRQRQSDALAWLSLEDDDNTPLMFSRYLLEALRPRYHGWSTAFQRYFQGDFPVDFSLLVAELVNQLHGCPHPLYLILDDYQSISHPDIHAGLNYLVNHAPASLHVIIGSRSQLPVALGRLQVQDQLVEIYHDELRFSLDEASSYFAQSTTTPLKPQEIQQAIALTEGWIAGIKMAALSLGDTTPAHHGLRYLNANSRSMSRYMEEVIFAPLPPDVLDFLLQTSMLNRLHPDLCDAVTGYRNGEAMLTWIAQHNLFLSTLDEAGFWFRYHPLMRDALQSRLQHRMGNAIHRLHERAGNWFAAQQLWAEAIRHALAAGKPGTPHAEAGAQSLAEEGDIDTLVRWIRYLPANVEPSRIALQINLAWALSHHFQFNDARHLLDAIETFVANHPDALDHTTWVRLRVVRAICEAFAENIAYSMTLVEPLLREVPCGDIWVDGLVCNILSYCHLANARPQQALEVQALIPNTKTASRNLFVEVYRAYVIAQGLLRQGNLREAERHASQALQLAEPLTGPHSSSSATLAPLLAEIAWEQGDIARINALLTPRLQMIDDVCPPDGFSRCYLVLAQQAQLTGREEEANALLLHAENLTLQRGWRHARVSLLAQRITFQLQSGDNGEAVQLLDQLQRLTDEMAGEQNDALRWFREQSRARLLIATGDLMMAAEVLHAVMLEQEHCGEWLAATRSRLWLSVVLWRTGETEQAIAVCKPAILRAVKQHLHRSLLDAGPELLSLLRHAQQQQTSDEPFTHAIAALWTTLAPSQPGNTSPVAPRLTEREHQTLQLIADGFSNKEIARALGISAETVKWHLKQLYEKLQVNGRIQAVNQARKWQWLA